ncbi:hypothetical protein O1611_g9556 [Lasiodiplodia mahajangana]|uniref:Uncharacterized protein n=1 Tax=Lasiodiplodia mahajangana TaxID=1108764 RepID=A0ACC2J7Y6_9PEZI|nr:hypothetical protein O1611_g9556 [Lasiodiplodia mahajangana]
MPTRHIPGSMALPVVPAHSGDKRRGMLSGGATPLAAETPYVWMGHISRHRRPRFNINGHPYSSCLAINVESRFFATQPDVAHSRLDGRSRDLRPGATRESRKRWHLTYDRDLRVNEQTSGPGPILKAIRQLITHVKGENIKTKLERMMPRYRRDVSLNTAIIDGILRPHIQSRFGSEAAGTNRKTVIDLALGQLGPESRVDAGNKPSPPSPEFVDTVISQLKLFIFAGHDTTSQAMYDISLCPGFSLRAHFQTLLPLPNCPEVDH